MMYVKQNKIDTAMQRFLAFLCLRSYSNLLKIICYRYHPATKKRIVKDGTS